MNVPDWGTPFDITLKVVPKANRVIVIGPEHVEDETMAALLAVASQSLLAEFAKGANINVTTVVRRSP